MANRKLRIDRLSIDFMDTTDVYSKRLYRSICLIIVDEHHKLAVSAVDATKICTLITRPHHLSSKQHLNVYMKRVAMDIILASSSPRRRELLASAQLDFSTLNVDIDETRYDNESPKDYIERMVATKAKAAIDQLSNTLQTHEDSFSESFIILTSDTIGVLPDGTTVLVKPVDRQHAYSMWQQMSDSIHEVWTAVQATQVSLSPKLAHTPNHKQTLQVIKQQQITERTEVTFIPLTAAMMSDYWDTGEPADKAGGYGIQGLGAAWVSRINGSYTNVVGLPLAQTVALIKEMRLV